MKTFSFACVLNFFFSFRYLISLHIVINKKVILNSYFYLICNVRAVIAKLACVWFEGINIADNFDRCGLTSQCI